MKPLLLIFLLFLIHFQAGAQSYYVSGAGKDTDDGKLVQNPGY